MMDERELDQAIDATAGTMMSREPGRALGYSVMARVRDGAAPARRRLVWVAATASLVLCGAITIALMNRAPATIIPPPPVAQIPVAQLPVAQPSFAQPPMAAASTPGTVAMVRIRKVASPPAPLSPKDFSTIDPLRTEPIVLSAIDVPQLERETTLIEALNIEPLTIEPLTASND